jgi:hypothetical protein
MKPGEKNIQYNKTNNTAERVVEQIVTPRNFIVGFASVDNEFLGVTICSSTDNFLSNPIAVLFAIK